MRTLIPWLVVAGLAAAWTATAEGGPTRTAPLRVGFIDVKRALNDCADATTLRDTIKQRGTELQKPLTALQEELRDVERRLGTAAAGSEKARQLQLLRMEKRAALESLHARNEARLNAELALGMGDLYRRLARASADLGDAGGYDAVFRAADTDVQALTLTDLQLQIGTRSVLWYREAHDLTDAVIQRLDGK